jgi:serine/threonine protein kinase
VKLDDRALDKLQDWASLPQPGDVVDGRFELRQRIGEGGMGVVYAAYDRVDERTVAVKIVSGGGEHDTARFDREVHALEGVAHPALVKYIAHGDHEGVRYIVMARLEGCSLAERLRIGRLSIRDTIDLGVSIAAARGVLPGAGVVHRDVKPANIFLVGDLEGSRTTGACLLDFGLARPADATTLTAHGALVGTPGYVAPERVRADDDARPPGDVFSLGCVLYECLLGAPPFAAETTYVLLARVLLEIAPLARHERPDTPLGLEALIEQMLANEPGERPPAVEVVRALEELRGALPRTAEDARREIAPGFAVGDVIAGKYRIEQRLGEGGMGVVLAARHLELGTHVAIKLPGGDERKKVKALSKGDRARVRGRVDGLMMDVIVRYRELVE